MAFLHFFFIIFHHFQSSLTFVAPTQPASKIEYLYAACSQAIYSESLAVFRYVPLLFYFVQLFCLLHRIPFIVVFILIYPSIVFNIYWKWNKFHGFLAKCINKLYSFNLWNNDSSYGGSTYRRQYWSIGFSVHLLCVANQSNFRFIQHSSFQADFLVFNLFRFEALQWTYIPFRTCTVKTMSLFLFLFFSLSFCFISLCLYKFLLQSFFMIILTVKIIERRIFSIWDKNLTSEHFQGALKNSYKKIVDSWWCLWLVII